MTNDNSYISFDIDFPKKVIKSLWGLKRKEVDNNDCDYDFFCWCLTGGKLKMPTDLVFYNNKTNVSNAVQLCEDLIDPIDPSNYDFPEFYLDFDNLKIYDEIIFGINVFNQHKNINQHLQNAKLKVSLYINYKKISVEYFNMEDEVSYTEFCRLKNNNNCWSIERIKKSQFNSIEDAIKLRQTNE